MEPQSWFPLELGLMELILPAKYGLPLKFCDKQTHIWNAALGRWGLLMETSHSFSRCATVDITNVFSCYLKKVRGRKFWQSSKTYILNSVSRLHCLSLLLPVVLLLHSVILSANCQQKGTTSYSDVPWFNLSLSQLLTRTDCLSVAGL